MIHRDQKTNNESNPFTIYVVKKSRRTGWNKIATASVHFDKKKQEYGFLKSQTITYPTIEALIEDNKSLLRFNVLLMSHGVMSKDAYKGIQNNMR